MQIRYFIMIEEMKLWIFFLIKKRHWIKYTRSEVGNGLNMPTINPEKDKLKFYAL